MPIVTSPEGTPSYTPENMNYQQAYQAAFGQNYSKKNKGDLSGTSSFALNYLQQQQQNAYELELWNLANKYNSPEQQMLRYQQAGLNPNLAYGSMPQTGVAGSSAPIPAKATNFEQENKIKKMNLAITAINQLGDLVEGVQRVVDYGLYGAQEHGLRNTLLAEQGEALSQSNAFKRYVQYPMLMSKYSNEPIEVTLPDGTTTTWNYNDTVEAMRAIASMNADYKQMEVADYMLNNIYPLQGQALQQSLNAGAVAAQQSQQTMGIFNDITEGLNLENPYLRFVAWKMANKISSSDPGEKPALMQQGQMLLLSLAKMGLL